MYLLKGVGDKIFKLHFIMIRTIQAPDKQA